MGGGEGRSSTLEGKKEKVERVKSLLDTSEMIFAVPGNSLAVAEVQNLRRSLPNGTTMSVVKNKLMARALEGTPHEPASSLLKGENMWFFIEEEIGSSIRAFNTFSNDSGKEETHSPKGGCLDKQLLDRDSIAHIATLPSKIELITKIASGINAVPLKLARAIKAPGAKLGRAINLATTAKEE